MITPELIELQRQMDEVQSLMFESLIRSSSGIEQCPICNEYYFRVGGHECEKNPSEKPKGVPG